MSYTGSKYKGQSFRALGGRNAFWANTLNLDKESKDYKKQQVGIWVDYFDVRDYVENRIEMSFGVPCEKRYKYGNIGFPCADAVKSVEEAKELIKPKHNVDNHCYCGFGIRKTEYDAKNDKLTHTIIMPCEYANVSSVIDKL